VPTAGESTLRISIEHLLEGVQIIGFDWTYLYLNETAATHARRPASQLIGRTMMSCYPGIERTEMFSVLRQVMQARRPEKLINEFTYSNGERRWFKLLVEPVPDGICVLSIDVTEREQVQARLRRSEERTTFALRAAHTGIWELRLASGEVYWSETLEEIAGLGAGQGPKTWDEFLGYLDPHDRETIRERLRQAIAARAEEFSAEFAFAAPDGRRRYLEGQGRFVLNQQGQPDVLLGVAIDVTERRMTELQLQQAQKMEAIGRLAGGVAHDFNNLLTAILGHSELVLNRVSDAEARADIDEIRKAGERASRLTRQLLAFSRKQMLVPQILDLNEAVVDLEKMLSRLIGEDVRIEIVSSTPLDRTRVDPGQIEQLLMNLVVNARDAMPQGGTIRIATGNVAMDAEAAQKHQGAAPGRYVSLSVADTGCGMTADVLAHAFEPFFTTKGPGKGTGLGLATVYGIVSQSGGYVTIDSTAGVGTTVTTYLPATADPIERPAEKPPAAALPGTETILVVEDETSVRGLIRRTLKRYGYTILEARDVADAIAIAARHDRPIHLLLTDIVMPEMNGPNLAQLVVRDHPAVKVLYVSGFPWSQAVGGASMSSRAAFLAKPFTPTALATTVRECLDR
jgi:two-component system, cell cycle sensor histidine kinase and response regulator CckA